MICLETRSALSEMLKQSFGWKACTTPLLIDLVAAPTAGACVVPTMSIQPQTVLATKEKPAEVNWNF
jgi:hypothetical protein